MTTKQRLEQLGWGVKDSLISKKNNDYEILFGTYGMEIILKDFNIDIKLTELQLILDYINEQN